MIQVNLAEAIKKATKPQAMVGSKWGSGNATTRRYEKQKAIDTIKNSHWQDCIWFRSSPDDFWIKASGYRAMTQAEKIQHNNSYRWSQEELSEVWVKGK
jgi:hypothetical protein